jgi:protein-(glutamine-N5) methyltransferase, release factor-specific
MTSISEVIKNSEIDKKEAVLLISFVLKRQKEFVIAHDDYILKGKKLAQVLQLFNRRRNHEPIAYLVEKKEFYGRDFAVSPDVLVPRPETEAIIEITKKLLTSQKKILDIGTGSGCIGITLKLECPNNSLTLSDISKKALKIAKKNAEFFGVKVEFIYSDLFKNIPEYTKYDIVIANLPYVDSTWRTSPELKFEPKSALYAKDGGLEIIKDCLKTIPKYITKEGFLVLELDPCQQEEIINLAKEFGFTKYLIDDYVLVLKNQ